MTTAMSTSGSITSSSVSLSTKSIGGSCNSNSHAAIHLWLLRHGQATHNPRAEKAHAMGCTFDEFFELMRQDDTLDAPLTPLGRQQAKTVHERYYEQQLSQIDLVVSSPLSRALETADLVLPPTTRVVSLSSSSSVSSSSKRPNRISYEHFREINGVLRNVQRRTISELRHDFAHWEWDHYDSDLDNLWDAQQLECTDAVATRAIDGLHQLLTDYPNSNNVLLVAHGGLLRYTMERCIVHDERRENGSSKQRRRDPAARFENCELRKYRLEYSTNVVNRGDKSNDNAMTLILTELDIHDEDAHSIGHE